MQQNQTIDGGRAFDWGRVSEDYARFRDVYPPAFYDRVRQHGIGLSGQRILDLGTGTGVLPRHLAAEGVSFVGADIAQNQIDMARTLSAGLPAEYICAPVEELRFADGSFDAVTACTCFFYFDHDRLEPLLHRWLKPDGRLLIGYLAWLPKEDAVAAATEELILRYNPAWTGGGETRRKVEYPAIYRQRFEPLMEDVLDTDIPFTRESWCGRIKASRGIGAALPPEQVAAFEKEHLELLRQMVPPSFTVKHYMAITTLKKRGEDHT